MVDPTRLHAQFSQYSQADQAGVQATLRAIIRTNPADPQAWLCLSACVPSLPQRRDCLEYAQRLDPLNPTIHAGLQAVRDLELRAMQRVLNECRSIVPASTNAPVLRLDAYLQAQGIPQDYIERALEIQRKAPLSGRRPLFGEILVTKGWCTPEQVADLLMRQTYARITSQGSRQLEPLGEYLLRQGHMTLKQLWLALITQLRAIQMGTHIRLGQVLISQRAISATQLADALHDQELMYRQLYY